MLTSKLTHIYHSGQDEGSEMSNNLLEEEMDNAATNDESSIHVEVCNFFLKN